MFFVSIYIALSKFNELLFQVSWRKLSLEELFFEIWIFFDEKLKEELEELQHEVTDDNTDKIEAEFGDVLFSMINYARFLKVNPENALERTNKKFIKRFQYLESKAKEKGVALKDMTLNEMDVFWEEAKLI